MHAGILKGFWSLAALVVLACHSAALHARTNRMKPNRLADFRPLLMGGMKYHGKCQVNFGLQKRILRWLPQ